MKNTIKTLVIISLLLFTQINLAQVGIGTVTPDDDLDVIGNTQVSGYLRVGDPATPQTVTNTGIQLFTMGGAAYYSGFTQAGCGTIWQGTSTAVGPGTTLDTAIMKYDNVGSRGNAKLTSPHIWVPSNASNIVVEISHYCTLENGYDGVFIEYSTDNGGSWSKVPSASFYLGGYTGAVDGSNDTCSGNLNVAEAWTGTQGQMITAFPLTLSNTWVQFRFVATEDGSDATGEYNLQNFTVFANAFSGGSGGAFAAGNIYAENNVYAGSNVLLGDLAEYFPVVGTKEKGDIISYIKGKNDLFSTSVTENDSNIIGIYSSNPTLTLNNPKCGIPVALQGRVPVNVVGEPIKKGDYLTSSHIPGKAMKANKSSFVVGRALEDFKGGRGQIICLVETGWKNLTKTISTNQHIATDMFPRGHKSMTIKNKSITKNSQVFITFKEDIGSRHWISDIADGQFSISIKNTTSNDVKFSYLVGNTAIAISPSKVIVDKPTITTARKKKTSNSKRFPVLTESDIPTSNSKSSPPAVSDSTKCYVWSKSSGLHKK